MNGRNDSNLGNKKVFADNLRHYIAKTGILQKDVAKVAGVSQGTITDWLSCRSYPRMDKIQILAEHFGIQMSDLVEERSLDNQYYLQKEAKMIAKDLESNPDILVMFQKFQKLSDANKALVMAMINSLNRGK